MRNWRPVLVVIAAGCFVLAGLTAAGWAHVDHSPWETWALFGVGAWVLAQLPPVR